MILHSYTELRENWLHSKCEPKLGTMTVCAKTIPVKLYESPGCARAHMSQDEVIVSFASEVFTDPGIEWSVFESAESADDAP